MSETLPYFIELRMVFNTTYDGIADTTKRVERAAESFQIKPDGTASRAITREILEAEVESRYKLWDEEILDAIRTKLVSTWSEEDETFLRKWLYKKEDALGIIGQWLAEAFIAARKE